MKNLLLIFVIFAAVFSVKAQAGKQEVSLEGAKAIAISASLSGLVIKTSPAVTSVQVNHVLTVDGEDRPDLRLLDVKRNGSVIVISERKPTAELLNDEKSGLGMSIVHNGEDGWSNDHRGVRVRAYLEIIIPEDVTVSAETLYGSIKAVGVKHMPSARSTYGVVEVIFAPDCQIEALDFVSEYQSVDVALPAGIAANISLKTSYGSMYSDFDYRVPANRNGVKSDGKLIGTINGGGVPISLTATYQNIYLRKL